MTTISYSRLHICSHIHTPELGWRHFAIAPPTCCWTRSHLGGTLTSANTHQAMNVWTQSHPGGTLTSAFTPQAMNVLNTVPSGWHPDICKHTPSDERFKQISFRWHPDICKHTPSNECLISFRWHVTSANAPAGLFFLKDGQLTLPRG